MSYTPPNTFSTGDTVSAEELQQNLRDLRKYLHDGISSSDLDSSQAWVRSEHIQPPILNPYLNLQEGVSGVITGLSLQPFEAVGYASSSQCGALAGAVQWVALQNSAQIVKIKSPSQVLYHYSYEVMAGPDVQGGSNPKLPAEELRSVFVAPYFTSLQSFDSTDCPVLDQAAQETPNNRGGFLNTKFGPAHPYEIIGFGSKSSTLTRYISLPGEYVFGLAVFTQIDRVIFPSLTTSIEAYRI